MNAAGRRPGAWAAAMARNRARSAVAKRERAAGRMPPGLRWVPVPLAVLAAVIGVLVVGSFQGQAAEATANQPGYRAGGLTLSVDQMYWLSNNMDGLAPGQKTNPNEFSMPANQMPGIQPVGDNRLRVEVGLANVTTSKQRYSTADFHLTGSGGKSWQADDQGHSSMAGSESLAPGFQETVDVYFDVPGPESKNLTLHWSRGGTAVSIPVTTDGSMQGMRM